MSSQNFLEVKHIEVIEDIPENIRDLPLLKKRNEESFSMCLLKLVEDSVYFSLPD